MKYALLLVPALAACGGLEPDPTLEVGSSSQALTPAVSPQPWASGGTEAGGGPLGEACPGQRWIGYQRLPGPVPACPVALDARWSVSKLFGPQTHVGWAPDLDRFCKYEWTADGAPKLTALPSTSDLRLERDCRVVVPLADQARAELADSHARALDVPTFPATLSAPATQVRIAVIDGALTEVDSGLPSGTGHGLAVAAVARSAGCLRPGVGCPFIATHQALRLNNGDHGYQSDVARAVYDAIRDFMADGGQQRLVINLSVGWDPSYGSGPGPQLRVPSYAVYTILQVAACEQALVVAAAGNRARVDSGVGPLVPGGWELAARTCPVTNTYAPLVHAVGGLTSDDQPLALSRASSRPRLAAPASRVTARLPDGTFPPPLSGSSMASASVAGVAALMWSLSPGAPPEQLMATLFANSIPLGVMADVVKPPSAFSVRRVDACLAARAVTSGTQRPTCSTRPAGVSAVTDSQLVFDSLQPALWLGPTAPPLAAAIASVAASVAPDITLKPWAGPQPTIPPCPLCVLVPQPGYADLFGQLDVAPDTTVGTIHLRACVGECDGFDPAWKITGAMVDDAWLKVPLEGFDLGLYGSARLEAEVRDDKTGKSTLHVSEVALDH